MFLLNKLKITFMSLIIAMVAFSMQANASHHKFTITKLVTDTSGFDVLEFALDAEGLLDTLDGKQKFTLFAPTNDAFQALADVCTGGDINALASALISAGLLDDVLLYHVVNYKQSPRSLLSQTTLHSFIGETLTTSIGNNGIGIKGVVNEIPSNVVSKGLRVSNGIVYPIDQVLLNVDPSGLCIQES